MNRSGGAATGDTPQAAVRLMARVSAALISNGKPLQWCLWENNTCRDLLPANICAEWSCGFSPLRPVSNRRTRGISPTNAMTSLCRCLSLLYHSYVHISIYELALNNGAKPLRVVLLLFELLLSRISEGD